MSARLPAEDGLDQSLNGIPDLIDKRRRQGVKFTGGENPEDQAQENDDQCCQKEVTLFHKCLLPLFPDQLKFPQKGGGDPDGLNFRFCQFTT